MTVEGIKPGDVVRHHAPWLKVPIEGVVGVLDEGWATIVYDCARYGKPGHFAAIDSPIGAVEYVRDGTDDEWRPAVVTVAQTKSGYQRTLARKEALARGWRELDREDVTLDPVHEYVRLDGEQIGEVYDNGSGWQWELEQSPDFPCIAVDRDAAINAVIAAYNNARRDKARA